MFNLMGKPGRREGDPKFPIFGLSRLSIFLQCFFNTFYSRSCPSFSASDSFPFPLWVVGRHSLLSDQTFLPRSFRHGSPVKFFIFLILYVLKQMYMRKVVAFPLTTSKLLDNTSCYPEIESPERKTWFYYTEQTENMILFFRANKNMIL